MQEKTATAKLLGFVNQQGKTQAAKVGLAQPATLRE
jgi:hypothetical protein